MPDKITTKFWYLYISNSYIIKYISNEIQKRKPRTLYNLLSQKLSRALLFLLIFLFAFSTIPAPIISKLPKIVIKTVALHNYMMHDMKLRLISSFKPYNENEYKKYYENMILESSSYWEQYISDNRKWNDSRLLQLSIWYELFLKIEKNKNPYRIIIYGKLGMINRAMKNDVKGAYYLKKYYENTNINNLNDYYVSNLVDIYVKKKNGKALSEIVNKVELNQNYLLTNRRLIYYYFDEKYYNKAIKIFDEVNILENFEEDKDILFECYYHLEDIINLKSAIGQGFCDNITITCCKVFNMLAMEYYSDNRYFDAAESWFEALSGKVINNEIQFDNDIEKILLKYKDALKRVEQENPHDYRINIWYFTYYVLINEEERAKYYLDKHLKISPFYKTGYVESIINNR